MPQEKKGSVRKLPKRMRRPRLKKRRARRKMMRSLGMTKVSGHPPGLMMATIMFADHYEE
jgi:hypothetical protein